MNNRPIDDNEMPAEIDFSKGVRGMYAGVKLVIVGPTPEKRDKDTKERKQ